MDQRAGRTENTQLEKTAKGTNLNTLVTHFAKLAFPILVATPLAAQTPLSDVFAACEASVLEGSDHRLREIGILIDESDRGSRIRVDTPVGTVLAMFVPPSRIVSACLLWGRQPELEIEFQEQWQDWVEWEEAVEVSEIWFNDAIETPGSFDLTDQTHPGYVVARCGELEHGLVLSNQPAVANSVRQIPPKTETGQNPTIHYQFSAIAALPERCSAAVQAQKDKSSKD